VRIVSLLPSATEILFALGAGDDVVGVTFECDYPPAARTRRIVSTSALPEGLTPAQIDAEVSRRRNRGEDLYHLRSDALAELDPDLVLTQDLCAVCAVDVSLVDDALRYLGCQAQVLTLDPRTLDEVLDSIHTTAAAIGRSANRLLEDLRSRLATVADAVAGRPDVPSAVLEWTDPPFAPGHWVPDMIGVAGGRCVLGASGTRSERTTWSSVAAAEPAVIVAAPCGYGLADSVAATRRLVDSAQLPAGVPVWAVDANASFARPGPRLIDGIEALATVLHPDAGLPARPELVQRIV
jgi:iron complex transport system substrate-binding protein